MAVIDPHEQAFRRGYSHGINNAIDAMRSGCGDAQLCEWLDRVMEWRYDEGAEEVPPLCGISAAQAQARLSKLKRGAEANGSV